MKATVTSIEDSGQSNLLRVHHERPDTSEGAKEGAVARGFVNHSRFSAHIPAVGDEIEIGGDEPAAAAQETEDESAKTE